MSSKATLTALKKACNRSSEKGREMRVGLSVLLFGALSAAAMVGPAVGQETRLGAEERTALGVTVYGGGLGLVRDRRAAALKQGGKRLAFEVDGDERAGVHVDAA